MRASGPVRPGAAIVAAASLFAALAAFAADQAPAAGSADYVSIPAGRFETALANDTSRAPVAVAAFRMRVTPVTRGEYREFLASHPQWQRGRVARTFADAGYLRDGPIAGEAADAAADRRPIVDVSWFAAQAYCESEGGRLPTWYEWEYVAAADADRHDARGDPRWRARILDWYATSAAGAAPATGGAANVYGARDVHGLIWEWVDDFNALMVNSDSRSADDPDKLAFCGAGAIDVNDRDNYAVLMRIALLSSLKASASTTRLGFRCVRTEEPS